MVTPYHEGELKCSNFTRGSRRTYIQHLGLDSTQRRPKTWFHDNCQRWMLPKVQATTRLPCDLCLVFVFGIPTKSFPRKCQRLLNHGLSELSCTHYLHLSLQTSGFFFQAVFLGIRALGKGTYHCGVGGCIHWWMPKEKLPHQKASLVHDRKASYTARHDLLS